MKGADKMGRFDGKVVLVTGGNRNTGLDLVGYGVSNCKFHAEFSGIV